MKRCIGGAVFGLLALFLSMPLQDRAEGMDSFTCTEVLGSGQSLVATWSLPASPTPDAAPTGQGFSFDWNKPPVTVTYRVGGTTSVTNVLIWNDQSSTTMIFCFCFSLLL